jgi:putative addiction module killer protein
MADVIQSETFAKWLSGLRDKRAVMRIRARIDRLASGLEGDVKAVGEGVSEARINYGGGYRLYYLRRGPVLVVMLCGGDKSSQPRDIRNAKRIAREWRKQDD